MTKTGLVIEGGATRGIYAAGVLDVLYERGIRVDGVIGVSAGAIHGTAFVCGQPGRSIRYYLAFARDPRFGSFRSLLTTGSYVGTEFCYHALPETLCPIDHDAFEHATTKFYVTCTDLNTGEAWYRETPTLRGQDMDALRAGASLPLVSKTVVVDGREVLDGGTADSIPLVAFQAMGYSRCLVIQTRPAGYQKSKVDPWLAHLVYRRYPKYLESIATRHIRYNETLAEIERQQKAGQIIAIRPTRDVKISHMDKDPAHILAMYELGRADALARLDEIKAFLNT